VRGNTLVAVTRAVSPAIGECELTHLAREPIDLAKAVAEHAVYEETLRSLGAKVVHAPPEPGLPDAVFVEDTALVFNETAVMTRPGSPTRRREVDSMARVLSTYRTLRGIEAPGTLDGGDVMVAGRKVYVGLSSRTNREGIAQLETHLSEWGYEVIPVPVTGCLHLKSAVTQVADNLLLMNDRWVRPEGFAAMEVVTVAPAEPDGANALRIGAAVIYPAHHPDTAERLDRAGVRVVPVPCGELAKAEGGVTCCSVVFGGGANLVRRLLLLGLVRQQSE
jgi:dimethylargininase